MCYDMFSAGMLFNLLGILTWFYLCYKGGMYAASVFYPKVVSLYKTYKEGKKV